MTTEHNETQKPHMIKELNHVGIRTAHMEDSIHFYRDVLGGAVIRDGKSLDGASRFVYVQVGVGVVELISVQSAADEGYAHVAFLLTGAVDAAYERLKDHVHFTVLPKPAGSGDGRLAFFEDVSGVIFELIERKENIRKPAFETPLIKAHLGTLIRTQGNLDACGDFYLDTLGFSQAGGTPGSGLRYFHEGDIIELEQGKPGIACLLLQAQALEDARASLAKAYDCGPLFTEPAGRRAFELRGPSGETLRLLA